MADSSAAPGGPDRGLPSAGRGAAEVPVTRSPASLLLICCLVSFACFLGSYLRIPVVPLYAAGLGATTAEVGAINAAFMLMAGLLAIPAGLVSDRVGRRTVVLGGLLIIAASSFLLYLSATPTAMIAVYLIFGIGLAAFSPAMMSYVADIAPPARLGRAYGMYTIAANVAMMLGPAAGGLLGTMLGLRAVFLVSGALTLLMVIVAGTCLPAAAARSGPQPGLRAACAELGRNRRFRACLLVTFGGCFGFGVFMTFLPLHLVALGMDAGHVGLVFAAQALANALSRIPFGRLSDRVAERSRLVAGGLCGLAAALALTGVCTGLPGMFACAALLGVSMGVAFTALAAMIADIVPRELRGMAMGGYNSCIYLGMAASATTLGAFMAVHGFTNGFLAAGAATLVVTVLFEGLCRRARVHPVP
ncbi:MAG: MFS transporter [Deltaproteobacteria bacterium]|nr:MAG: MFS transporter [Deltaproteobacteria bacterium]